jgi:hypothetical protein
MKWTYASRIKSAFPLFSGCISHFSFATPLHTPTYKVLYILAFRLVVHKYLWFEPAIIYCSRVKSTCMDACDRVCSCSRVCMSDVCNNTCISTKACRIIAYYTQRTNLWRRNDDFWPYMHRFDLYLTAPLNEMEKQRFLKVIGMAYPLVL